MNDSAYEEYMRSVLGYQPMSYNTYEMDYNNFDMPDMLANVMPVMNNLSAMSNIQRQELENCYPDIYQIIYPMVQKACMQNTRTVTRELIDDMTNEIYSAIEDKELSENRKKEVNSKEDRQRIRNPGLNDLIRILILRELLGRPGFPGRSPRPPMRPPMHPPMRPPMGPPRPPMRPPIGPQPRTFNRQYDEFFEDYDLYEY